MFDSWATERGRRVRPERRVQARGMISGHLVSRRGALEGTEQLAPDRCRTHLEGGRLRDGRPSPPVDACRSARSLRPPPPPPPPQPPRWSALLGFPRRRDIPALPPRAEISSDGPAHHVTPLAGDAHWPKALVTLATSVNFPTGTWA